MKLVKIIVGFVIAFNAGREYILASITHQSFIGFTLFAPVLLLLLGTWLIGSGFSVRKFKFKSFEFIKFLSMALAVFSLGAIFSINAKNIKRSNNNLNKIISIENNKAEKHL